MVLSSSDLREIKSTITSVFNDKFLQDIADKVAGMVEKKFEAQLAAQREEIMAVRTRVNSLEEENNQLRLSLDSQEQAHRNLNIRIFGMGAEDDENLRSKVLNLFKDKLKVNINNDDIKKCHRVTARVPNDKPPAVMVRFSDDAPRLSVLKNRKNLKNTPVQIKEDLTKLRLSLLTRAVQMFSVKSAWVLNGNVYVKRNDVIHRIADETGLSKLEGRND